MTESPFIPDSKMQYAWDSTSLGLLKECPRKYEYTMIHGYRGPGENVHFRFGSEYHLALENYDKLRTNGLDHEATLRSVVRQALINTWDDGAPWKSDHNLKTRATLIRSIVWYLEHFRDDPAKTITLSNGKPAVELSFRMNLDLNVKGFFFLDSYMLCGHLDRVVEFNDSHYVMDRKTTSSTIGPYFFDGFQPDNQMSLYTLAAQVVYKAPVKGVIIDGVQVAVGFSRFERGFTYRTQEQLEEWLKETQLYIRRAEEYAIANYWPMNDKACNNYGGCAFRKICSKTPSMRKSFLESNFVKKFWNPLEVR